MVRYLSTAIASEWGEVDCSKNDNRCSHQRVELGVAEFGRPRLSVWQAHRQDVACPDRPDSNCAHFRQWRALP